MKSAVLIDSSAWVEVSRKGGDEALRGEVESLLLNRQAAMAAPVWVELFQGAKGKREEEQLERWRSLCRWLDFDQDCWNQAAISARSCLRAGVNVPFGDLLVHACARRHKVALLERDKHFAMIAKVVVS